MEASLEQALQEAKLVRQVNALIVAHLRENNLHKAAAAVASATLTPLTTDAPPNRLLELVAKWKGGSFKGNFIYLRHLPCTWLDISCNQSHRFQVARCARFSPDGRFLATGSSDTSIKLFEVSKMKQAMLTEARDGAVRPVIRTLYDHSQPINDLDFHPQSTILISGAKDNTIKFFDFSKTVARRAFRVIQDTHNVRSVCFHPCGEYLLAGTDHPIPHLYDINTFKCYLTANAHDLNTNAAINQVRYSATGSMYVTASKDGSVRVWDGATAQCIRPIIGAHGSVDATSACFSKDQRFILSCGKDSTAKLWEVGTGKLLKQYTGAVHTQLRSQAVFNDTEEFVLSIDEPNNEVVIWDALTTEKVAMWPSNHIDAPRWIEHSPTEAAFVTCGNDRSVRFWRETP